MICSYKRRLCRRRSTSRRWSRKSWAFTCPRSSPVWSNPFFFTVQTEEESLWLSCVCHLSSGRQPLSHFWWSSTRLKAYYLNTSYLQAPFHLQGDVGSLWDHEWTFWAFWCILYFPVIESLFVCLPGLCIANMQCFCSLAPLSFSPLSFFRWDFCIFPVQQNELCSCIFPLNVTARTWDEQSYWLTGALLPACVWFSQRWIFAKQTFLSLYFLPFSSFLSYHTAVMFPRWSLAVHNIELPCLQHQEFLLNVRTAFTTA